MPDCSGCPLAGRRAFLHDAAIVVAAAMTGLAILPSDALALPIRFARAVARRGTVRVYRIPSADGATIDRDAAVILVRHEGWVYAFALRCPHQNTALRWRAKDNRFQCPKHKSKYQPDGTFISGRATRGMDRHAVSRNGGNVVVDLSRLFKEDEDPAGWSNARIEP